MDNRAILDLLQVKNQDHIIHHVDRLPPNKKSKFFQNCNDLDLDLVFRLHNECCASKTTLSLRGNIKVPRIVSLPVRENEKKSHYESKLVGESLISNGKVAVLIVAGGQGVRLGHNRPKGTFPVSPIMKKTLFQLLSEQVRALSFRYNAKIPLLIMTSVENHDDTVLFFDTHNFFGLDQNSVYFFQQGMLPTITPEGKLLLKDETSLFVNPDGHGGSLSALNKSGLLDMLMEQGFSELFYCQIDNPLVRIADPVFLGYHSQANSQCSTKVVRRQRIDEKVGVYVSLDGKDAILEYSDFGGKHMEALDDNGEILYWAGNTAIHIMNLSFVKTLNTHGFALPYHCANKNVEILDSKGTRKNVDAWKFETFVFDAIPFAERTCCMEVDRSEEFSPVKNKSGPDSPSTAHESMVKLHKRWLHDAGIIVPHERLVEISPLFSLDREELISKLKGTNMQVESDLYLA
ncbi:MAG: UDPGP type 1 family protein [Syntrophorhabdus sp.]|nr:UDPGP type 1 family protein [Syntrophorhabdus sp.]